MSDEYLTIVWREPIGEDAQRLLEAGEWTFSSRSHVGRERDALRAENERLRADAERWRFMRANYGHMTADMLNGKLRIHVEPRRWGVVSPEDADAAIDAAMKASGLPESP